VYDKKTDPEGFIPYKREFHGGNEKPGRTKGPPTFRKKKHKRKLEREDSTIRVGGGEEKGGGGWRVHESGARKNIGNLNTARKPTQTSGGRISASKDQKMILSDADLVDSEKVQGRREPRWGATSSRT